MATAFDSWVCQYTRGFCGEQILQVAGRIHLNGTSMIEKVRQAEQYAGTFRAQRMRGFMGVKEPRQGYRSNLIRQSRGT